MGKEDSGRGNDQRDGMRTTVRARATTMTTTTAGTSTTARRHISQRARVRRPTARMREDKVAMMTTTVIRWQRGNRARTGESARPPRSRRLTPVDPDRGRGPGID